MRTKLDVRTKRSVREVVDGQQRLRAILGFARGDFALTRRAQEFAGMKYEDLDESLQEEFLSYPLAVDSLVNASDTDVLEVFARLNSYTVTLVAAEKRHAKFQGDFKWAVHGAAKDWRELWEEYEIVSGRDRLRMGDDSLMAEMFGVVMKGVTDGGAPNIERLYEENESAFPSETAVRVKVDHALQALTDSFGALIKGTPLCRAPQFLMLFAAIASLTDGIPQGQLQPEDVVSASIDVDGARDRLSLLAEAIEEDEPSRQFVRFRDAAIGSTQRIATRAIRYRYYRWALTGGEHPAR